MLKLKVKLYQWFGIYFASKEELEYIKSKEYWKSFRKMLRSKKNDMSPENVQGLLIGCWQAKHGFYRPIRNYRWKRRSLV